MSEANGRAEPGGLVEGADYHLVDNPDAVPKLAAVHTQAVVAAIFNVSTRTVREWLAAGCPGKAGEYVVADILHWKLERDAGRPLCRACKGPIR